jgi:hypothetical protein
MTRLGLLLFTATTACSSAHHELADASSTRNDASTHDDAEGNTRDGSRPSDAGAGDATPAVATTAATDVIVCTIDSLNLYCITSTGDLWSQPKAGSAQTSLLSFGSNAPTGMTTDGTSLYVAGTSSDTGGYVESMPVAGGALKVLLGELVLRTEGDDLVLLDEILYMPVLMDVAPMGTNSVAAVPIGGVPVVDGVQYASLVTANGASTPVIQTATDGTDLFDLWDEGSAGESINDAGHGPTASDPGNATALPAAGGLSGIAVDATNYYGVGTGVSGGQFVNQVVSISRSSGNVTVLASTPQTSCVNNVCSAGERWSSLVADGDYLYWGGVGEVLRVKKTGGTPEVVYQQAGLFVPSSWMFDSTYAYWIVPNLVSGSGPLMRWKK